MKYAPLVICAFNRANVLKATISSLENNEIASETDLYIFIDGPRANHEGEEEKVKEVIAVANSTYRFKSVTVIPSVENKGLAKSITGAATQLLNQYGKVIVVEDDLFCSKDFLKYMNQMLNLFENDQRVMQVSGYGSKIHKPHNYSYDMYLSKRAHSWSWATWKDRWETVDWEVTDFEQLASNKKAIKSFNEYGSDLFGMLKGWKEGRNNSWYIRFNYAMHKQGRYSVCPIRSLVRNDGFGLEATHCSGYNRYKIDFELEHKNDFCAPKNPQDMIPDNRIMKEAVKYWSIRYRIYGKIMNLVK